MGQSPELKTSNQFDTASSGRNHGRRKDLRTEWDSRQNVPLCEQGRLDAQGGVCKSASSGEMRLYRCIRLDGNPLAPPSFSSDIESSTPREDSSQTASHGEVESSSEPNIKREDEIEHRQLTERAKSLLHRHSCLTAKQSSISCGEEAVLCEVSSAPVRESRVLF